MNDEIVWRTSTRCGESGQYVKVGLPPNWRKSSRSAETANCVELAEGMVQVAVRDSKDPDGPILRFPRGAWGEFVTRIKVGDFDY